MPAIIGGEITICGSGFSREYRWDLFAAEAAQFCSGATGEIIAGMARSYGRGALSTSNRNRCRSSNSRRDASHRAAVTPNPVPAVIKNIIKI